MRGHPRHLRGFRGRCGFGEQLLQPGDRLRAQPTHDLGAKLLLKRVSGRSQDAFRSSRRLDPLGPAPRPQGGPQALLGHLHREDLRCQPPGQPFLIGPGRLPEPQRRPDLGTVILDGAARPLVLAEQTRLDLDLPGHVPDRGLGYLAGVARNRTSSSKNFNNTLNPKRVAPDLLPTRRQSSSTSVHDAIRSSGSHSRRTSITSVSSIKSDDARHTTSRRNRPYFGAGVSYRSAGPTSTPPGHQRHARMA